MDGFDNLNIAFYLQAMGLRSFPGSAIEAALPSGMGSKMGSFQWKCVEYKGQDGFVYRQFFPSGRRQRRRYRIEQGSQEMRTTLRAGPSRSSRAWHSNEIGRAKKSPIGAMRENLATL